LLYAEMVLVGSLITSVYLIGNMGVLISNLDAAAVSFRKKRDASDKFVVKQSLPNELAGRLHLYQQCAWARGAGQNLQLVVQQMNPTIRADIMHHICHSIFVTIPLFEGCGPKFISALMETMQLEVFPQNEWVCHKGSISTAMYIVMKGTVSVIIDEVRMIVVKRLSPGDFFGERSLFGSEKRNASIQAKTTVELVLLMASRFDQVLQLYPEVRRTIEEAKLRREAETKAAAQSMDQELARTSHLSKRRGSFTLMSLSTLGRAALLTTGATAHGHGSTYGTSRRDDPDDPGADGSFNGSGSVSHSGSFISKPINKLIHRSAYRLGTSTPSGSCLSGSCCGGSSQSAHASSSGRNMGSSGRSLSASGRWQPKVPVGLCSCTQAASVPRGKAKSLSASPTGQLREGTSGCGPRKSAPMMRMPSVMLEAGEEISRPTEEEVDEGLQDDDDTPAAHSTGTRLFHLELAPAASQTTDGDKRSE